MSTGRVGEVTEQGIEIDGRTYEIPALESLDMDECQILYDYSGTALEDFAPGDPNLPADELREYERAQVAMVKNPAFKRALVHIAYRRENRETPDAEIRDAVGAANMLAVTTSLFRTSEADDGPPAKASQSEPASGSDTSKQWARDSSGGSSQNGSDEPGVDPENTGTGESGTSSPALARVV